MLAAFNLSSSQLLLFLSKVLLGWVTCDASCPRRCVWLALYFRCDFGLSMCLRGRSPTTTRITYARCLRQGHIRCRAAWHDSVSIIELIELLLIPGASTFGLVLPTQSRAFFAGVSTLHHSPNTETTKLPNHRPTLPPPTTTTTRCGIQTLLQTSSSFEHILSWS